MCMWGSRTEVQHWNLECSAEVRLVRIDSCAGVEQWKAAALGTRGVMICGVFMLG